MKTIAFYNPEYALPIPAIGGGAVEELENIFADENEKQKKYNFVFFQPQPTADQKKIIESYSYQNSQFVFLEKGHRNLITRAVCKFFRCFKIRLKTKYEKDFLRKLNNHQFNKIVFEGNCPILILKDLCRKYGKDNLYFHIHSDYKPNVEIAKYVGHLIGVSSFVLRKWPDFCVQKHLNPINCHILKNNVRNERFLQKITISERERLRNKFGFVDDDLVVIFCGRIIPEKGVLELMNAVCCIKDSRVKLLIIGSPNFSSLQKSEYLEKVHECVRAHPDKIFFTGYIENKEVYKYYQSADLHVVPSVYEDAAPLVVYEGMLSGLPQVVTNSGGVLEYINKHGCVVLEKEKELTKKLRDAIEALSMSKKHLSEMGQLNLSYVKEMNNTTVFYGNFIKTLEGKNE